MSSTSSSIIELSTPRPTPTLSASSPSFAAPTSWPSASCTRSGNTASSLVACATATVSFTAVPPSVLADPPATLPPRADGPEGPPSLQSSTRAGTGRAVRARSFSIPDRSERCGAGERGVCCFFKTRLGRKWRVLYSYRPRGRDRRCCARSAARSRARREHDCPGQAHPIPGPVTSLRAGPTEPSTAATTGSGTRGDDP